MKKCNTCNNELNLFMFGKDKRVKSGISNRCKKCSNQKQKEYRAKNPDIHKAIEIRSRKNNKKSILAGKKRYYEKIKTNKDWQDSQKKKRIAKREEKREYDRKYRIDNRERLIKISAQWAKDNPELTSQIKKSYKARRRAWMCFDSDSTKDVLKWELKQDKKCHWCKSDCSNNYHIDHYIPLSKGGRHMLTNLVISCPTCNIRKNAKMPDDFLREINLTY